MLQLEPTDATTRRMSWASPSGARLALGPSTSRMPYLGGLDGLRALAVTAVLAYHADAQWLPGGFLGVEIFFVVSGYLITALLLDEHDRSGTVDLTRFWTRRARRLLPALAGLLVGVTVLALLYARDALASLPGQVAAAATYSTNWVMVAQDLSYFESFGRPPLLQHLWSLAIEEQFYLLWPLLVIAGIRLFGRRGMTVVVVGAAALSTLAMWSWFDPTADPSRLYYGTDTRATGLLVGAALALLYRPWRGWAGGLPATGGGPLIELVGLVATGGLVWLTVVLDGFSSRLYQGGFLATAVLTAGLVAVLVTPGTLLGLAFAARPLRWLGKRSYGVYLWHWPVFLVLRPQLDTTLVEPWLVLLRIAVVLALAEVSYRYIELPVREGRFLAEVRELVARIPQPYLVVKGVAAVGTAMVALLAIGWAQLPHSGALPEDPAAVEQRDARPVRNVRPGAAGMSESPVVAPPPVAEGIPQGRIVIEGDSVLAGAADELREALPGVEVDSQIGRQWHDADVVLRERLAGAEERPAAVVLHLGNNGALTTAAFDAAMAELDGVETVVVVTVRVPREWEGQVNRAIRDGAERWPQVTVADWHAVADTHPEFFADDGVHLTPAGARAYADLVVAALTG